MTNTSHKRIPSAEERTDLLRTLAAWTQNTAIADDLTQQALVEAWKSDRQPTAEEWRPWLFGIARNVFYRWRRDLSRDLRHCIPAPESIELFEAAGDQSDLDALLHRTELVQLISESLDLLSAQTRQILLLKYVHDFPQIAIANELGLHEKAVEGRLHRGKSKIREHILTWHPDMAVELGIISGSDVWQTTQFWCHDCGGNRLEARWSDDGHLRFECPSCLDGLRAEVRSGGSFGALEIRTRPSFARVMDYFDQQTDKCIRASQVHSAPCPACDNSLSRNPSSVVTSMIFGATFHCRGCDATLHFDNLLECGINTLEGVQFREIHQKIARTAPILSVRDGTQTIQSRWVALDGSAEFLAWHDSTSGYLLESASHS